MTDFNLAFFFCHSGICFEVLGDIIYNTPKKKKPQLKSFDIDGLYFVIFI